jgi:hypothetical protein
MQEIIQHGVAQQSTVAQSEDAAPVGHGTYPTQFTVDADSVCINQRFKSRLYGCAQVLGRLIPTHAIGQIDAPSLKIKLPSARRYLTDEFTIIKGWHTDVFLWLG